MGGRAVSALIVAVLGAIGTAGAQTARAQAAQEEGRRLFTGLTPSCALCHTLRDAGATGAIGPSLDELKPDRERVLKALRTGIGPMPAFVQLTPAQMEALASYIEQATR